MSASKEEKKKECTLDSIKSDYDQYGYLEDYQVEWLLNEAEDYKDILLQILQSKENYLSLRISPDFFTLVEETLEEKYKIKK